MDCGGGSERKSDSSVIAPLNRNTSDDRSLCCRSTLPSQLHVLPFLFLTFHPPSPLAPSRIFSSYSQKFACKSRNECVSVRITNRKRFSYSPFIKSEPTRTHRGRTLDPISASSLPFLPFSTLFSFHLCARPSPSLPLLPFSFLPSFLPSFFLRRCIFTWLAAAGSTRRGSII